MTARLAPADTAATLLVVLLWGLNVIAGKLALAELPPFALMTIRFGVVALLLAPLFRPRLAQIPRLGLLAATLGVGHFSLLFVGLRDADAGSAAVTIQLGVPFSVLGPVIGFAAGAWVLDETVTPFKVVGGLLTVAGVAVIELRRKA